MLLIKVTLRTSHTRPFCYFSRYQRFSSMKRIGSQRTRDFWKSKDGEHAFLEEVEGDKALDWVRSQNAISLSKLGNPETNPSYKVVLEILDSKEKIPYVSKIGDLYYNFWQDAQNIRGLLRRTTLESYQTTNPHWETVLDLDMLGRDEGESWVYKGSNSFYPFDGSAPTRSMIMLSPGGSDACVYREFDLVTCKFIPEADGGFVLPVAKSSVSWLNQDVLLVGTDFAKDKSSLTDSGYPMDVRLWKRGADYKNANKLFEGAKSDVSVTGYVSKHRNIYYEWRRRSLDFYTSKKYLRRINPDKMIGLDNYDSLGSWSELDVPSDASVSTFGECLLIHLKTSWKILDNNYPVGSLLTAQIEEFISKGKEGVTITALFTPNEKDRISLESYSITLNFLVLEILENVKSRLSILKFSDDGWSEVGREDCARIRGISISAVGTPTKDVLSVLINFQSFLSSFFTQIP
jgi:prolyl oligopeptidase